MDIDWREHLRWVHVDARPLNVVDIGSGPAVVFLHGLAGCWQNWLENIPASRATIASSRSTCPASAPRRCPPTPITMPGYARMLDELFVTLGDRLATLVGSSMGGFVAAEFAIRYGAQVDRLCLTSPAGPVDGAHAQRAQPRAARADRELPLLRDLLGRVEVRSRRAPRSGCGARCCCSSPRTPSGCRARSSPSRRTAPASPASPTRSTR